ncbi:unnamed protein product [Durusdinium trenchii]|uniref:Pentatricopeptide repeat-containing protein, chloroplastic n=1 Tax=Durusdinium trenchii TaxID=1381693 RepID=A0ABP0IV17_9DINO
MTGMKRGHVCRELTITMKHLTRRRQWQLALETLQQQLNISGFRCDMLLMNTALSSLAAGEDWRRCIQEFQQVRASGYMPDAFSTGALLSATAKSKKWKQALVLADEKSVESTNNFIGACEEVWPVALTTLGHCQSRSVRLSHATYLATTRLCRQDWERALHFARLEGDTSRAFVETMNSCLSAFENSNSWEGALAQIFLSESCGLRPDTISFSSLLSTCEKGLRWRWALEGLQTTQERHICTDRTLLNAAISAQEKGSAWIRAIALTLGMRRYFNCEPNVISFNAACSACEKAAQWICSLQLFKWAKEKDLQVDTISANALLATCRGARRWQEVLQLLKELSLGIFLDDLALRLAIETHLDRRVGRVDQDTLELMDRMDLLWINVLSRKLSKGWLDFG